MLLMYAKFCVFDGSKSREILHICIPHARFCSRNRGRQVETSPKPMLCLGFPRAVWVMKWNGALPTGPAKIKRVPVLHH